MKKVIAVVLILALFVPGLCVGEGYSPSLGMTMDDFLIKYNSIGSSLSSSLVALKSPYQWTVFNKKNVAWFKPDNNANTTVALISSDIGTGKLISAGLDEIQIFAPELEWLSLISVTKRCVDLFSDDIFTLELSAYHIADLICYYYENYSTTDGYSAYRAVDAAQTYYLNFMKSGSDYYFSIKKGHN